MVKYALKIFGKNLQLMLDISDLLEYRDYSCDNGENIVS